MLSASVITARTAVSIARLVPWTSIRERVNTRRSRIASGKSHSCEIPVSCAPAPSAQTISVADGNSDTTRGSCIAGSMPRRRVGGQLAPLLAQDLADLLVDLARDPGAVDDLDVVAERALRHRALGELLPQLLAEPVGRVERDDLLLV